MKTQLPSVRTRDRVSFALGRKISDDNYGSFDVHVSYSSDVSSGETPDAALLRVAKFVETAVAGKIKLIKSKQ